MTSGGPPRFARWLLERFGRTLRLGSLVGDLDEEHADGRSRAWYWRQVVGALAVGYSRTLRMHSLSFILALAAGCAVTIAWQFANNLVFPPVFHNLWRIRQHAWTAVAVVHFSGLLLSRASVFGLCFVSAWVVTRVHRAHQRAVLVAFVLALTAQHIPWLARLVTDLLGNARFATYLEYEIIGVLFQGVFVLASGLWAIRTHQFSEMNRSTRWLALLVAGQLLAGAMIFAVSRVLDLSPIRPFAQISSLVQFASIAYLALLLWKRPVPIGPDSEIAHPQTN